MTNPTTPFSWQMPTATDLVTDLPADFEVFGQAVATSMADLLGGTTGQILAKASNTNMDFTWVTNDVGDITAVTATTPLTGGGTSGAITVGIQDATTSVKGAVQLSDSTSTTSSILAATPTAVKSAYDLATTASTNANNITMVQQYTATESVLKNISSRVPAAEQLLKQAVYWIDAAQSDNSDQVLDNQGWGAPSLTTQLGSSASADSNDPKFLDFDGTNYVYVPGVSSNYLSTPDAAALDVTGDLDLRAQVALDDWTPAAASAVIAKDIPAGGGGTTRSYALNVLTTGALELVWSSTGTNAGTLNKISTVATGVTDGAVKWIRATLDVDNGAVGNDVKFFLSNDGITWTQLGTTVTTALTTSVFAGTADLLVGARGDNADFLTGKIYRAQVLDGIDGTKVLDVNTSTIGAGSATSFTALTGQTVTISRSTAGKKSAVVTHPVWLFGTDDYMEVADNALLDFAATESFTALYIGRQWATPTNFRYLLQKITVANVGYGIFNNGTALQETFAVGDGTFLPTNTGASYTAGSLFVLGGIRNVSTDNVAAFSAGAIQTGVTDTTTGTLANANVLNINKGTGAEYTETEMFAVAIFRRALTSTEISTITNYYTARVGA